MTIVEVQDLWKRYPGSTALRGVSLQVPRGVVLGVLGENGSGKSTLLRILAGVSRPSRGTVRVLGRDPRDAAVRRHIAFLPEVTPYDPWMRVRGLLDFLQPFYPGWDSQKARMLLDALQLDPDRRIGELSKGQQARLKLATAFAWPSDLVLLDEPLGGIDPPSRHRILHTLFSEFRYGEQTIVLSTHLVQEVEEFLETVVFLHHGEVALQGSADDLRARTGKSLLELFEEVVA